MFFINPFRISNKKVSDKSKFGFMIAKIPFWICHRTTSAGMSGKGQ